MSYLPLTVLTSITRNTKTRNYIHFLHSKSGITHLLYQTINFFNQTPYVSLVLKLFVCMCLSRMCHCARKMTQSCSKQSVCVCLCVRACVRQFARPCGELALNSDAMLWPVCCGTWPPLCCVSSTLRGSTIPQPLAHNTHHSNPQTTTEHNLTTPSTTSTQSFNRWKKKTKKTFQSQQPSQTTKYKH